MRRLTIASALVPLLVLSRALREFQEATRGLLGRSPDVDEATRSRSAEWRLVGALISYISLLADIRGTPLEREAGNRRDGRRKLSACSSGLNIE